jgi:hypothetical protein
MPVTTGAVSSPATTLDGAAARAALLGLVVQLGVELRRRGQAARALTLMLSFVGGPKWEKTRRLTEPSADEDDLRLLAYQVMDAAGLQRGRLTSLALRGEDLVDGEVAERLSLDTAGASGGGVDRRPDPGEVRDQLDRPGRHVPARLLTSPCPPPRRACAWSVPVLVTMSRTSTRVWVTTTTTTTAATSRPPTGRGPGAGRPGSCGSRR